MDTIKIITPAGILGRNEHDNCLDSILRDIAIAANKDPNAWAEKYGVNFENDIFMMHEFCWCDKEDCPWCRFCEDETGGPCNAENNGNRYLCENCANQKYAQMPNFFYKPKNFKVWWYKYIGRDVETNKQLLLKELEEVKTNCLNSLKSRRG